MISTPRIVYNSAHPMTSGIGGSVRAWCPREAHGTIVAIRLAIAVVPLLAAGAHAGKLAPLPLAEGPHGIVSIETRPSGARVVLEREGTRYLACRKTPCRFEAALWAVAGRHEEVLYRFPQDLPSELEVVAGEETRYAVELHGGFPNNADGGFLLGLLGLIYFVPVTIMAIHEGDSDGIAMLSVPTASSAILVFPRLTWPARSGRILSQERRRIDAHESVGNTKQQHGSDGEGSPADDSDAGSVIPDTAVSQ
jgi:hypothetical protein